MHAAWTRFGRLPWRHLFAPVLRLCKEGHRVQHALAVGLQLQDEFIKEQEMLQAVYQKPDGTYYKEGDLLKMPLLGDTLQRIAEEGPDTFYTGTLANDIVSDIEECGGIMTKKDLADYKIRWRSPSVSHLRSVNYTVYSSPLPTSGPVLQYLLNILEGYNLTSADINGPLERRVRTYHRIAEAFKFAYAKRSYLGDPDFVDMEEIARSLTSRELADETRARVTDNATHGVLYYKPAFHAEQRAAGTSHVSVLGARGEAVAVTSTINLYFGSKCLGRRTGITFNNQMNDFNRPGDELRNGFSSASANFIAPGKRPMSGTTPTIILRPDGDPAFVLGASGALQIVSQIGYVTAHALWMDKKLHEAIDTPRIHHQLLRDSLFHEPSFDKDLLVGLRKKGHVLEVMPFLAVIQGIYSCKPHCPHPGIFATCDIRKRGYPDGY